MMKRKKERDVQREMERMMMVTRIKGNKNDDGKGRNKSSNKSRRDYSSDDSDHNKRKSKSRSKKDYCSDEDDKRRSKS